MNVQVRTTTTQKKATQKSFFREKCLRPVRPGIARLNKLFPELSVASTSSYIAMIERDAKSVRWVEQCVPLIRPGVLGKTYQEELTYVLSVFEKETGRQFIDLLSLDSKNHSITQLCHSCEALQYLCDKQPNGDLVIVPAQLGAEYKNRSMNETRKRYSVMLHEFGFRLLDTLVTLLAFPEQQNVFGYFYCLGDVCNAFGVADHSPVLRLTEKECILDFFPFHEKNEESIAMTGCVPI